MTTISINQNTAISTTAPQATDLLQAIWQGLKAMGNRIALAYTIYSERRALRKISNDMLDDMGITRAELNDEINRSIFDIPENRK